jgi:hypothetical protein
MIEDLKQRAAGRFYYLASPYTHPSASMRDLRAAVAYEMAGELMAKGLYVYAAIPATHEAAKAHTLPTNYEWWVGFNESFIKASAGIIVCCIPGWEESRGVKFEIEYAKSLGLPIYMGHLIARDVDVRPYLTKTDQLSLLDPS